MVLHYATYFDRHYLPRGVALYQSLVRHSPAFVLWVLCLDDEVERTLAALKLPHVRTVPLAELERADPAVRNVKSERLPIEYYWTCGPAFLLHVLRCDAEMAMLTYLDADLFFFGNPLPIYQALGDGSILIKEQHPWQTGGDPPRGGKYNVGCLVFRASPNGLACLDRWREQCLAWCFDRFEPDRHGDQKYLDDWPERFGAVIVRHTGVGLAPWHLEHLFVDDREGDVRIEHDPLICYHFARVHRVSRWIYEIHDYLFHRAGASATVRRRIYAPYVRELYAAERRIQEVGGRIYTGTVRTNTLGELARRARRTGVSHASPTALRRFMFVSRSVAV